MTLRGIYSHGIVIVEGGVLRNGTPVDIRPSKKPAKRPSRKAPARGAADELPGFGMWKDRPEWRGKSAIEIARELRRQALGDRHRG